MFGECPVDVLEMFLGCVLLFRTCVFLCFVYVVGMLWGCRGVVYGDDLDMFWGCVWDVWIMCLECVGYV